MPKVIVIAVLVVVIVVHHNGQVSIAFIGNLLLMDPIPLVKVFDP